MSKELRELLARMEDLKGEIRDLLANDKAKKKDVDAKMQDMQELQSKIDAQRKLDEMELEGCTGGAPVNGYSGSHPAGNGPVELRDCRIFAQGQSLADYYAQRADAEDRQLDLGRYVKGALIGDWHGAAAESAAFSALSTGTATIVIPEVLSSKIIDMIRNRSLLFGAGVPLIIMDTNNLTMAKLVKDPVFGFKKELAPAELSDVTFEGVKLESKTAYGLMQVSLELVHSASNLSNVLQTAMVNSLADVIDKKCLFGEGPEADEPKGILTYDEINSITATEALESYAPFVQAVGKIRQANGEPNSWGYNATVDEKLNLLTDTTNQPLNQPKVLEGLTPRVSNQLPANEGTGEDESTSMIFDSSAMAIGLQSQIRFSASDSTADAYQIGAVYMRVYAMLDICLLQPKHVTKITGLK